MNSEPIDHAKHPTDPSAPPRSVWLRTSRLVISLVILATLWLIYPLVSIRVCAARVASYYEPVVEPKTGQITSYVNGSSVDLSKVRAWEERLERQPTPRLLALLPSRNPIGVWVIARAIEHHFRGGRFVGWPGKREPVPPLDAIGVELILKTLDQDLPTPVTNSLIALLATVPSEQPHYREMLFKATEHQKPSVRQFGIRVLDSVQMESDETVELVERLAKDSDPRVRATLIQSLVTLLNRQGSTSQNATRVTASIIAAPPTTGVGSAPPASAVTFTPPVPTAPVVEVRGTKTHSAEYQAILLAAMDDDSEAVRSAAMGAVEALDLETAEVSDAVVRLWSNASPSQRRSLFSKLTNRLAAGRLRLIPPKIVDAMFENPAKDPAGRSFGFLQKVLALPDIPADRQWQLIESELKGPESDFGSADIRNALFLPTEPQHLYHDRMSIEAIESIDWKYFRARFRPFALEAKPRLLEWATEASKSEDENTVLSGVGLLTVIATEEPDRLTPFLSHDSAKVRIWALRSLVPSAEQLPHLWELLKNHDENLRGYAAGALTRYAGPLSEEQVDQLFSVYRQGGIYSRPEEFFHSLRDKAPTHYDLRQFLIDCLNSDALHVRHDAVLTLRTRSEDAKEAWPHLVEGIRSGRLTSPAEVLVIEAGRPIESPEVAGRLFQLLWTSDLPRDRNQVEAEKSRLFQQLTKLCPPEFPSSVFLDVIVAGLEARDENSPMSGGMNPLVEAQFRTAARLLNDASIDPSLLLPRLQDLTKDERWESRQCAVFLLGLWGLRAKAAAGILIERLDDSDVRVRIAASEALGAIGPDAGAEAAAALAKTAKHDKISGAQMSAVEALGKMEQHIQAHRDTLEELSKRGDPMVRRAATKLLNRQDAPKQ